MVLVFFFCVILALMEGPPRNKLYKPVLLDRILGGEVREGTSIQRRMALVLEHEMYFGPIRLCVDSIRSSLALYFFFLFFFLSIGTRNLSNAIDSNKYSIVFYPNKG